MKKLLFIFILIISYSCSTSTDNNDNSNSTAVPVPPSDLIGTVVSSTQINLSWTDNSTNETGFKIERKTGSANYTLIGTVNQDVLTFSDSGLAPNTIYTYRVYSYNSVGVSPTYSNELVLTTDPSITMIDINGNSYPAVIICNKTIIKKNLNVTKYTDGTTIPQVTDPTEWANKTTGAWCYYNNDPANGAVYGKLYNWYAVAGIYDAASLNNASLRKKLAPNGWHIPTDSEWSTLINCLDPSSDGGANVPNIAGGKMKSTGTAQAGNGLWESPNTNATNESGFTALPGGLREFSGAGSPSTFKLIGTTSIWWSSTMSTGFSSAVVRSVYHNNSYATRGNINYRSGLYVRCIKD